MHVCMLCNEYPPAPHGGIGTVTQTLGRALVARGHRVTVLGVYSHELAGEEVDHGVRIIRLPHTRIRGTGFAVNGARVRSALDRLNAETPIDILEGPELGLALIDRRFAALKVIRMHGGHHFFASTLGRRTRRWRAFLERRSFSRADAFCAVSAFVGETTRNLIPTAGTIEVLPNPVDVETFRPPQETSEAQGLLLFVGTVCEKKGIRQLLEAMPRILKEFPSARLCIAGRDSFEAGQSFTAGLSGLAPRGSVEFLGHVEHEALPALFARAQVCVFPSHMEAQGVVVIEAMAAGKAVIASRTGPGPEIIEDRVSGLLCDPFKSQSIADAAIEMLKDPALRARTSAAARMRAVSQFSTRVLAERNEQFYERCLRSHGAH